MTALSRAATGIATPPIRIVHLGLGAFHRAHQAWYTDAVDTGREWGIAAFTGRRADAAEALDAQDGLYTLIVRGGERDEAAVVGSIADAVDGADVARLVEVLAAPTTALVTITITEAGYRLTAEGHLDTADPVVAHDLAALRGGGEPTSTLGRLLAGLQARRASGAPIALVPCDNIPGNAAFLRTGLLELAEHAGHGLADWVADNVSVVSTSVDRITPRAVPDDLVTARELTGWDDRAPVVTEPFHDWVLEGDFPQGRPAWEQAGARFVADVTPWENRKLWLLNGAHSLLAYLGIGRGHALVAEALNDPSCREAVQRFWDEARSVLADESLQLDAYCAALLDRFANPRIRHELAQIAVDGVTKLRLRVVPVALALRAANAPAPACATGIAAWIDRVRAGDAGADSRSDAVAAARGDVRALLTLLSPDLADDREFRAEVTTHLTGRAS